MLAFRIKRICAGFSGRPLVKVRPAGAASMPISGVTTLAQVNHIRAQIGLSAYQVPSSRPTHRIYAISKNGDKKIWRAIGALWPPGDGKGFNHKLDCLPLNGAEIVIREIDAEAEQGARWRPRRPGRS